MKFCYNIDEAVSTIPKVEIDQILRIQYADQLKSTVGIISQPNDDNNFLTW